MIFRLQLAFNDPSGEDLPPDQYVTGRDVGLAVLLSVTSENASVWLYNPNADHELLVFTVIALHTGSGSFAKANLRSNLRSVEVISRRSALATLSKCCH